ncbi:Embryonic polarity protein dorsal [Frankliniella fusca]|uniref:Embryonic polarity protein dorsal n=1 Tax=Frankliniella fusca TaxID=407009 RepID=A0AAE1LT04_9NEOP|nr:Embryonic polarity protein dorsal [Frankliniella fusca]
MMNQLESYQSQTNSSSECPGSSKLLILEQPAPLVRFRYKSEGIHPIQGITSTSTKKTFPKIQIVNFDGLATVVISCVTRDPPYRPHPHCLDGDDCKWGIYQKQVHSSIISFEKLGVQFTKRKEIEKVMQIREMKNIDPFQTGFQHCKQLKDIDLDWIRLCFQVFVLAHKNPKNDENKWKLLDVQVSEPIHHKKAATNLRIVKLSDYSASVEGGKEILMFCDKVKKDDVEIRFFEQRDNTTAQWEAFGLFHSSDVHQGYGISFRTPSYKSLDSYSNTSGPSAESFNMLKTYSASIEETRILSFDPFQQTNTVNDGFGGMLGMKKPSMAGSSFIYPDFISCNKETTSTLPSRPEEKFTVPSRNWPGANETIAQPHESSLPTSCTLSAPFDYMVYQGAVETQEACADIAANATLNDIHNQNQDEYCLLLKAFHSSEKDYRQYKDEHQCDDQTERSKMMNQLESYQSQTNSSCECPGSSKLLILEQPAPLVRFGYKGEGFYPIQGITSTSTKKTFPKIQIVNFDGLATVVISCVTRDPPYRPHPHCLDGNDCEWGIYQKQVHSSIISFEKLGVQFTKRREIWKVMQIREMKNIDPFQTGFQHCKQLKDIDLNWIRLCFQVFVLAHKNPKNDENKWKLLDVQVSEPIHNKTAATNLRIVKLSDYSASVEGGKEILMFCDKVVKDDVEIRFFEQRDNTTAQWEAFGLFHSSDVHRGYGISFRTPPYKSLDVDAPVEIFLELRRPSDFAAGDPVKFLFLPVESNEKLQSLPNLEPNSSTPPICSRSGEFFTCRNNVVVSVPDQLQTVLSYSNTSGPFAESFNMLKTYSASIEETRILSFDPFQQTNTVNDGFGGMLGMKKPSMARSSFIYPDFISCNKETTSTLPSRPEEKFTVPSRNWPGANETIAQPHESLLPTSCTLSAPFDYMVDQGAVEMQEACADIAANVTLNDIHNQNQDEYCVIDNLSGLLEDLKY